MRNSKKSLLFGLSVALLAVTVPRVVMRYLRHLTTSLLMLCVLSTPALATGSGLWGPSQNPPRSTAVLLSPDEAREVAATLSDCETVGVELASTRAENRILREALDLTKRSAAAFEEASKAQAARADNEKQRAENETFLRATAEANLKREKRAGKWRALRWGAAAPGIGVVVGVVMGGE